VLAGRDPDVEDPDFFADFVRLHRPREADLLNPMCALELSAINEEVCLRAQCTSGAACAQAEPLLTVLVTRRVDVAVLVLIAAAVGFHLMHPIVVRSKSLQLLLAAVFGVAVVLGVVAYFVLSTVTQTRFGKLGAFTVFAVGGATALVQGAASTLYYWFAQEFARNTLLQTGTAVCSAVSATVCYRYLGSKLSHVLSIVMRSASLGCGVLAVKRNPEGSVFIVLFYLTVRFAWLVLRFALRAIVTLFRRGNATQAGASGVGRRGGNSVFSAANGLKSVSQSDPRWDWNDPSDDLPPEASQVPTGRTSSQGAGRNGLVAKTKFADLSTTRRELDKLAAEIRKHPSTYAHRLNDPNQVLSWAGEADLSDDE
jgi:hypothetical protein